MSTTYNKVIPTYNMGYDATYTEEHGEYTQVNEGLTSVVLHNGVVLVFNFKHELGEVYGGVQHTR